MTVTKHIEEFKCSKNPYRDFGFRNPDQALVKSMLAMHIQETMEQKGLSQREAGELMGIDQAKVSTIINGKLKGFAIERLLRFLNALDVDVEIKLKPRTKKSNQARTQVTIKG